TLTLLNMWHTDVADWESIIELLAEPAMAAPELTGTLSVLSGMPDRVPSHISTRIAPLLRKWMTRTPAQDPFEPQDVRGLAADALNALHPGALTNIDLWSLMAGTREQRASAVLVIARRRNPTDINLLAAFAQDEDVKVRSTVASCLAGWVKEQVNPRDALELLQSLLQDSGTRLARSVSGTLANSQPEVLQQCESLVEVLKNHISADVRRDLAATLR
ncbi:HEAT repeat domain-containing protein, partial [Kocuria marina]